MVTNSISPTAKIGKNVKIWNFVYIGKDSIIGDNVRIASFAHIDYNAQIGDNTKIEAYAIVANGCTIGKNVFIGPNVVMANDPFPVGNDTTWKRGNITIHDHAVISSGVIIGAGVTVGENSVVGMGSLVTKDIPPNVVAYGTPAKIRYTRAEYDKKRQDWINN